MFSGVAFVKNISVDLWHAESLGSLAGAGGGRAEEV